MTIINIVSINKYAQELIGLDELLDNFSSYDLLEKRTYLKDVIGLIIQSNPKVEDIEPVIKESKLKSTFTPCILLRKGVANHHLQKIIALPDTELSKGFILLLNLFKIAYKRRFDLEKNTPNKWWYWDLADEAKVHKIINSF